MNESETESTLLRDSKTGFYPHLYKTIDDGFHHPCDAQNIEPQEFLLCVMRDQAIPFDLRIWAVHLMTLNPPEWLSEADWMVLQHMQSLILMKGSKVH
jgi:hypothetical protein